MSPGGLRSTTPSARRRRGAPLGAARGTSRQLVRYLLVGGFVGLTYVALTLLFSGPLGLPIGVAIGAAYVLAVVIHFLGQRTFVFAHVDAFELSTRSQVLRYVVVGVAQYLVTAGATAVLPELLGVDQQVAYLLAVAALSAVSFLILSRRIFHGAA